MARKESQSERTKKFPLPNLIPSEFAAMGRKRVEGFVKAHVELVLPETNRRWFERMQSEVNVGSAITSTFIKISNLTIKRKFTGELDE